MPQVDQVHRRSKNLVLAAVAGSVVVVIAIVGVVFFLFTRPSTPKTTTAAVQSEARDKAFSGDKDEAIDLLKAQLAQAKTDDEKTSINMQLGGLYQSKSDFKSALEVYKSVAAKVSDFGINDAVATTAEKAGDKAIALDYNQRNRKLIKDGKAPYNAASLPRIEESIVRLGGKL